MLTVPETSRAVKAALRKAFPGVKFSVRNSTGTGYGWLHATWTDGPTVREVDKVVNPYRVRLCGINISRHYSEAEAWAVARNPAPNPNYDHDPADPNYTARRQLLAETRWS